ncbi:MAG: conjugal transfer protein TraX, partial [Lachnospiraceae bacterium]|nr:conjugal transfer protein TraX [Lachnospiraceae bacterium]
MDASVKEMPVKKGVTGTTLKIIAIVAMFIDHFAAIFVQGYYYSVSATAEPPQNVEIIMTVMRAIGRFGFPIFAFLLVEGFTHTRSVKKYALNLGIFALISELPFNLGFMGVLFYPYYQNVFFTLLLGLLCLWCISEFGEK